MLHGIDISIGQLFFLFKESIFLNLTLRIGFVSDFLASVTSRLPLVLQLVSVKCLLLAETISRIIIISNHIEIIFL